MLTLSKPLASSDLCEAIALCCSPVFGALNMMNALGGAQTDAWNAVRTFTLEQLIDEAAQRDLDLSELMAACSQVRVFDTPPFQGALRYDPRPRCVLCNRVHYVPKSGESLSCGDAARFRNPPQWRWSRAAIEAAVL